MHPVIESLNRQYTNFNQRQIDQSSWLRKKTQFEDIPRKIDISTLLMMVQNEAIPFDDGLPDSMRSRELEEIQSIFDTVDSWELICGSCIGADNGRYNNSYTFIAECSDRFFEISLSFEALIERNSNSLSFDGTSLNIGFSSNENDGYSYSVDIKCDLSEYGAILPKEHYESINSLISFAANKLDFDNEPSEVGFNAVVSENKLKQLQQLHPFNVSIGLASKPNIDLVILEGFPHDEPSSRAVELVDAFRTHTTCDKGNFNFNLLIENSFKLWGKQSSQTENLQQRLHNALDLAQTVNPDTDNLLLLTNWYLALDVADTTFFDCHFLPSLRRDIIEETNFDELSESIKATPAINAILLEKRARHELTNSKPVNLPSCSI